MPVKDHIYAAPASIFVLLYEVFQINESRGRLCFQERRNDVGIDTSTNITRYIFQVTSIDHYMILYFIIRDKNTTPFYFLCGVLEGIYKRNIKMLKIAWAMQVHTYTHQKGASLACVNHIHVQPSPLYGASSQCYKDQLVCSYITLGQYVTSRWANTYYQCGRDVQYSASVRPFVREPAQGDRRSS